MTKPTLQVMVRSREGVKYQGPANFVSGINARGLFDILPMHSNFISTISQKLWLEKPEGERVEFNVDNGVIHVSNNQVLAYLSIR